MKNILAGTLIIIASLFMLSVNVMAQEPCTADFTCDLDVDADDVTEFLNQFGRNPFNDPCPDCYDSPCPCTICPSGQVDCTGTCVDTDTDEDNCGSCGNACSGGFLCVAGQCELTCQTELTNCTGTCVDTDTDESNCGSCGNACSGGDVCVAGSCEIYCSDNYALVPNSGQTTSYVTGDDGDLERGVVWPSPRFTDNGDGTVTDNLSGLIWLKNTNCFGQRTWNEALSDCNGFSAGFCGLTDGSSAGAWRLPSLRELQSIIDYGQFDPALTPGHPFTDVLFVKYWASTTAGGITVYAWTVQIRNGIVDRSFKTDNHYVLPVRDGQ